MIPVPFSDIGKPTKDLLGKDFPTGTVALEVKTTSANGVQFTASGNKDNKSGAVGGELKAKFAHKPTGLTLTETFSSSSQVGVQVEVANSLAQGLKLDLSGALVPGSNAKTTKVGAEYKQEYLFVRSSLDLFKGPTLAGDAVVGADGYLVGGEVAYDIHDAKISKYSLAVGYTAADYSLAAHALNGLKTFSGSYYHRVSGDLEAGAKATYETAKAPETITLEVGGKWILDKDAFVKTKVDTNGKLGLGYSQVLRPGVKLGFGALLDTTRLNDNAHKFGLSLSLESQ